MCTGVRFTNSRGEMFFGRNLDWTEGYGQKVVITPRGYKYKSAFLGTLEMKYAVIGMAVVEEDIPLYFDCGNEAGLMIAGLNFPGYAQYESEAVEGKSNIAAYEFPLWVAMNFKSVDEVEEALGTSNSVAMEISDAAGAMEISDAAGAVEISDAGNSGAVETSDAGDSGASGGVAIVSRAINENYPVSMLHWIIGDKERSIVVEYTKEGLEIFHNDVDILTNQPGYSWHRENLRNYMNLSSIKPKSVHWGRAEMVPFGAGAMMRGMPGDYYSSSRFVRAAYLNTHYPVKETEEENVARLFHTLSGVEMIDGMASSFSEGSGGSDGSAGSEGSEGSAGSGGSDGSAGSGGSDGSAGSEDASDLKFERTIYTSGFSAETKTYYWNIYEDPAIRKVKMDEYDLDSKRLIQEV